MQRTNFRLRGRRETWSVLAGIAIGTVSVALALPFAVGDSPQSMNGTGGNGTMVDLQGPPEPAAVDSTPSSAASGQGAEVAGERTSQVSTPRAPGTNDGSSNRDGDVGVAPDSIKVGIGVLDLGQANRLGINVPSVNPEMQRRAWSAYFDATNRAGGIRGTKIDYVFDTYDVLSRDDKRRSCLRLTQDERAFAIFDTGGYENEHAHCITAENGTLLLAFGSGVGNYQQETIARADGLLIILFPSADRTLANLAWQLPDAGVPKTAKIGILADEGTDPKGRAVDGALVPQLQSLGFKVTHRSRLSQDLNTAASQVPVEVQQMRSKGVDHVIMATTGLLGTPFVQHADAQGWHPQYLTSDFASGASDTFGTNMPDSFEGSLTFTVTRNGEWRLDLPPPAYDSNCSRRFEEETGESLDRTTVGYATIMRICTLHDAFVKSATNASPDLTRRRLSTALQNLGDVPMGHFFGGAWRPGRFDAATHVRTAEWRLDCKTSEGNDQRECWLPRSDFRPLRF